ncbi:CMRF35-like molecule 1 [Candoia aspera]|uniref:CMRF35-like molecule 1 n=1 Tax=Candoia aspera TaxID=51853 RepID=UPI002FD853D0
MLQQHLTVGLLLLFVLFLKGFTLSVIGPSAMEAFLGKSLSVKCQYDKYYHNHGKYWCKGSSWSSCTTVVQTDKTEEEKRVDRTVIRDNQTQFEFTVRMENLTEQDTGIYWCAIDVTAAADPSSKPIVIEIRELPSTTTAVTTGYSSTVSIPPTENTMTNSKSNLFHPLILLPVVFVALLLMLGVSLLMWRLKKKKAVKSYGDLLPSKAPSSDEARDGTEVAYTSVIPTPALASQIPAKTEIVDYASLRFSALNDQATYANV